MLIQEHDPLEEVRGFRIFVSLRIEVGQGIERRDEVRVSWPELQLLDLQDLPHHPFSFHVVLLCQIQLEQVLAQGGRSRVVQTRCLLAQRQGSLIERLGFRVSALLDIQVRQIGEDHGCIQIAQRDVLCFRKRTLIERLGLGIAALLLVEMRQVIAVGHQLLVCRSKPRLNEREDVLHERIRLGILTLLQAELDEVVEVIEAGHVWSVCCPQDPFIQRPCLRNVAQVHVQVRQMAQQANGLGVLKTAHALINADGTFQQRLGLPVLILERVDIRQLVEQHRHHGLFRLWQLFSQTQSP